MLLRNKTVRIKQIISNYGIVLTIIIKDMTTFAWQYGIITFEAFRSKSAKASIFSKNYILTFETPGAKQKNQNHKYS